MMVKLRIGADNANPKSTYVLLLAVALSAVSCQAKRELPRARAADGMIAETVDSTFVQDVLSSGKPSVVYYRALWCVPCWSLGPHVTKLASRYAGRVTFWELDRGSSAERVRRYEVPALPTLVFYADQREMARLVGMPTPATDDSLAAFVEAGLRELSRAMRRRPDSARIAPSEDSR